MFLDYFVFVSVATAAIKSTLNGRIPQEWAIIYIGCAIFFLAFIRLTRLNLLQRNPIVGCLFGLANFALAFSDGDIRLGLLVAGIVGGIALMMFGLYYMLVGGVRASMGYADFEGKVHDGGPKITLGTVIFLLIIAFAIIHAIWQ